VSLARERACLSHERTRQRRHQAPVPDTRRPGCRGGVHGHSGLLRGDPTLVRPAFALLTVFGGVGVLLYLGAWVVIPDEVDGTSIAESMVNKRRS
jgi:phage shock protein PspC (stress-responsive transcriptional regulator)